ncbi:hypothetical protein TELCIR_07452 [Teladorsagia circumcincta]|uniref:Uncharacterized protein n=1 Tax=Teladorsagia circumcincta TaxID=45464 RepID=A0A2G9UK94_TELCI|nr:hypothetical protein TELCIR_07452 [Teladorsagia circumcincta]
MPEGAIHGLELASKNERNHAGSPEMCSLLRSNKSIFTMTFGLDSREILPLRYEMSDERTFTLKPSSKQFYRGQFSYFSQEKSIVI